MDHSVTPDLAHDETDNVKTAEQYIRGLEEMIRQMRSDQQDINRIREERSIIQQHTDDVIAETWKILARIRETG